MACENIPSIDFQATNKSQWVGEFANTESVNKEDWFKLNTHWFPQRPSHILAHAKCP